MRETETCVISKLSGGLHIQLNCTFSGKKRDRGAGLGKINQLTGCHMSFLFILHHMATLHICMNTQNFFYHSGEHLIGLINSLET